MIAEDVLQEDTIANIIIRGNERVSDDTVLTYANISKGDRITPELIKNVIKRLYQTNYFDDISVTQNFNDLIIVLTEKPIVSSIIITDNNILKMRILFPHSMMLESLELNRMIKIYLIRLSKN